MAEGDVGKVNYGFVLNNGKFESVKENSLKEALISFGAYNGLISSKIAHALLVDKDFKASDCLEHINNNCFYSNDRIEAIITFEEINLDKLD